jgi:SHS2 domain-containing protein
MEKEYIFAGNLGVFTEYEASGDLGIRAQGADLLSAIAAAAHGLVASLISPDTIRADSVKTISAQGRDKQEMVVNFLNEVIFLVYGHRWIPKNINTMKLNENLQIDASFSGESIETARHHIDREIKAVTYHNLSIVRYQDEVTIELLCDL